MAEADWEEVTYIGNRAKANQSRSKQVCLHFGPYDFFFFFFFKLQKLLPLSVSFHAILCWDPTQTSLLSSLTNMQDGLWRLIICTHQNTEIIHSNIEGSVLGFGLKLD